MDFFLATQKHCRVTLLLCIVKKSDTSSLTNLNILKKITTVVNLLIHAGWRTQRRNPQGFKSLQSYTDKSLNSESRLLMGSAFADCLMGYHRYPMTFLFTL